MFSCLYAYIASGAFVTISLASHNPKFEITKSDILFPSADNLKINLSLEAHNLALEHLEHHQQLSLILSSL
jgi:hypothetical protein